jgi:hypothetical protein
MVGVTEMDDVSEILGVTLMVGVTEMDDDRVYRGRRQPLHH